MVVVERREGILRLLVQSINIYRSAGARCGKHLDHVQLRLSNLEFSDRISALILHNAVSYIFYLFQETSVA